MDQRLAGDGPEDDPDDRADDGRREHLARKDRADLPGGVADGLHDPDVPVARQDHPGHDVGDQEGRGQHREDREREQHGNVEVGDPVDAGLQVEIGLSARATASAGSPPVIAAVAAVRSAAVADGVTRYSISCSRRPGGDDRREVRGRDPGLDARRADRAGDPDDAEAAPRARRRPERIRPVRRGRMDGDRVPDLLAEQAGGLLVEDGLARRLPPAPRVDRDAVDRRIGGGPRGELGRDHPAVRRLPEDATGHRPRAGARGHR